jgi:hypothetical protein
MSRRKQAQNEAVAERAQQILAEKAQRRRRPKAAAPETPMQPAAQQPTRPKRGRPPRERKERKPRVHHDLLTIAFRGPLASHFRELAERHRLSLSALLQDAMLSWESNVAAGYQPGTALAEWKAQHPKEAPTV